MKAIEVLKSNKGFTLLEAVLSLFVVSIALLVLFTLIVEINNTDNKSKEINFSSQLLEPYLSYYKSVDVTKENLDIFLSDMGEVDLVKEARDRGGFGSIPVNFNDLNLVCMNDPIIITNDEKVKEYIKFSISCEKDGNKINKGNPFIITRFIN